LQGSNAGALSATVALHIALLTLLLVRGADMIEAPEEGTAIAVSLLDLSSSGAGFGRDRTDMTTKPAEVVSASEIAPTPLDTSQFVLPDTGWALSEAGGTTPGSMAAASGGGRVYDPQAGAAPTNTGSTWAQMAAAPTRKETFADRRTKDPEAGRRQVAPAAVPDLPQLGGGTLFELDRRAFARFREDVARTVYGASGKILLRVQATPVGTVATAHVRETTLADYDAAKIAAAVVGQQLFLLREPTAQDAVIDLPTIRLGG
jgi:hypothetical protein